MSVFFWQNDLQFHLGAAFVGIVFIFCLIFLRSSPVAFGLAGPNTRKKAGEIFVKKNFTHFLTIVQNQLKEDESLDGFELNGDVDQEIDQGRMVTNTNETAKIHTFILIDHHF